MTQAKLRLAEVLGREETPEGKIKHLQYLRAQAEGRHSRVMEKKATSLVGSKSRDEGKASAAAEQDFIARIDAEILRLNRGR